jgi:hypothetical protein
MGDLQPGEADTFDCLKRGMEWVNDSLSATAVAAVRAVEDPTKVAADVFVDKVIDELAKDHHFPGQTEHWRRTLKRIHDQRVAESKDSADVRMAAVLQTAVVMSAVFGTMHYEAWHMRYVGMALSHSTQGSQMEVLLK